MAFYLNPELINVSLKTWLSTSDEIGIITKVLCLKCTENELKKWLSPTHGSPAITHLTVTKKAWENLSLSNENCVFAFDILLMSSDYRSKHSLHIILKFEILLAKYSLSVQYLISKHDWCKVMGLYISIHSWVYY